MNEVVQLIGWLGAAALLWAYGLLTSSRVSPTSGRYLALNLAGSAALGLSTAAAHAWPSVTVNVLWLALGIGPLVRARARRRRSRQRLVEVDQEIVDVLYAHRESDEILAHL